MAPTLQSQERVYALNILQLTGAIMLISTDVFLFIFLNFLDGGGQAFPVGNNLIARRCALRW
jgi:hypothetical protein